jgi:hypothetical protein
MPSIMAHDPRIPQMGLPPPGYPMHPYMIPQFMLASTFFFLQAPLDH